MADTSHSKTVNFKPGDIIIRDKSPGLSLFIVNKGQIHVFKETNKGEKLSLAIVNSGEYLGEIALFGDRPHQASAEALTEVECIEISAKAIKEQIKGAPKWLVALTQGLVERLLKSNELLRKHGIVDKNLYERVQNIKAKYSEQSE